MTPPLEPEGERNERIFAALPKLGSEEYLALLRRVPARDLPAPVLVRAYRQLGSGRAAEATLERLLLNDATYGYLRPLRRMAARKVSARDWFSADDLVDQAIGEIALALAGPRGEGADKHWLSLLRQRLEDAYRSLNGRRGERRDPPRAEPREDPETGLVSDPADGPNALHAPWHGRVDSGLAQWLEEFVARTLALIPDDRMREAVQDQFSADPSPVTGKGSGGKIPLTKRYGVSASTIHKWCRIARAKLLVALQKQDEREIDLSWLTDAIKGE